MKKCFQAKGVCTITAHTPLSATLVWQLSHYLFRETCFMNSYPKPSFYYARFLFSIMFPLGFSFLFASFSPSVDKGTQGFRSQKARHNCVVLI